jgi:hypothetical protein
MSADFEDIAPPLSNIGADVKVSTIFREDAPCRTLETILEVSADVAPKIFAKIANQLFAGKLVALAQLPLANFSVQKLLNFCNSKEQVLIKIPFAELNNLKS